MLTENTPQIEKSQANTVAVRSLVEFVMMSGDISSVGFQMRDRAQAGIQGHMQVQASRPEGYRSEVEISWRVEGSEPPLEVCGRIDGLFAAEDPVIIEEIKTTTLSLDLISEDHNGLHWGQLQCYAFMYAKLNQLDGVLMHLVYFHLDRQEEKIFERYCSLGELETFFNGLVTAYLGWFQKVSAWQAQRDRSIAQLEFPFPEYRAGQREMAVSIYKTIRDGSRLYVQSPTGVGKTIASLFPAIKAMGQGLADRIFYLTARTPGRTVAEKAMDDMRQSGLYFRSVTLTAKEKICFCPPVNCDPEICIFARGYFDKAKKALLELDSQQSFTRPVIEQIAREYQLCPFEFSLDLSLWVDCIICDYNYVFDPRVYLHRFFDYITEKYIFLVDEAHNLPDRARSMYSAEMEKSAVLDLQRTLKPHLPALAKKLGGINKTLLDVRKQLQEQSLPALVSQTLPAHLLEVTREFCKEAEGWLVLNQPSDFRQALLDFYFTCLTYLRTAEYFDTYYVSYFERLGQGDLKARLFCLDPAPMLAGPLSRSQAAVFFSASMLPIDYFTRMLTGDEVIPRCVFSSPFPETNACLLIHNQVSTRYEQRADSYPVIASAIEAACSTHPGNYLVFFPSYAYLAAVLELLQEKLPDGQLLAQNRSMTEPERENFLARFSAESCETLVGLAVMGGIFGEGIDLVGERLIGVIVVGVGVPQLGLERDLIRDYFDRSAGRGFAYAYQYPGFNRVLQATGRLIRTETDRGIIILIDSRFIHARYRQLFPAHWSSVQVVNNNKDLKEKLARFWMLK